LTRSDAEVVEFQLRRPPRGRWRVVARCPRDFPTAIAVAPAIGGGVLFPTTFWLTCPLLVEGVHALESAGEHAAWSRRAKVERALAEEMRAADAAYRAARASEGAGIDPCAGVGVAGQRDPLQVKCLHARLAAYLGGVGDPIGEALLARLQTVMRECDGTRCSGEHAGAAR
jgi:hypothetical protein